MSLWWFAACRLMCVGCCAFVFVSSSVFCVCAVCCVLFVVFVRVVC